MNKLMEILQEIDDTIAWTEETALIDDRLLDSFSVVSLVAELEEAFDIELDAAELVPENFNSADAMYRMIVRLQGK